MLSASDLINALNAALVECGCEPVMTPEEKRNRIATVMGFKDSDFLKWHDGMWEAQQWLIDRQKAKTDDDFWNRYVDILLQLTAAGYGMVHATVAQKQDAFLKAIGEI